VERGVQNEHRVPTAPLTEVERATNLARRRHFLTHDPDGSFVAIADGAVVGLAHALRRGNTFGLAMLAVDPRFQDQGIGQELLGRALSYANGASEQYIYSSNDPRALHRYVRAGFDLHPAVRITPRQEHTTRDDAALRIGTLAARDLDAVDEIDHAVRKSTRRIDVTYWLNNDVQLVLHDEGGYALFGPNRVVALCARSEEVASELLHAALCGYPDEINRSVAWIVAEQQWAFAQAASDKATLEVHGAVMTRGMHAMPHPYLPNGLFT
jgi:predicted N-acetyltransferase YhbS